MTDCAVVRTDALGVAPFFYRKIGESYLFSSHATLLHLAGDSPNLYTWITLLQTGCPVGDDGFYQEIKRFPPGTEAVIGRNDAHFKCWFDIRSLPDASARVDDSTYVAIESATSEAIQKCLKLRPGPITLPFSSGYDSRRFFACLHANSIEFNAITCQTFHWKMGGWYDLDLPCAPKIASAFGVPCTTLEAAVGQKAIDYSQKRLGLVGTETFMHTWAMPLMDWFADQPPSLIFDGLAGDALGNHGYEFSGLHETPEKDLRILVDERSNPKFFRNLSSLFPNVSEYRAFYESKITSLAPTLARSEILYLQARTRRGISTCITMMHPPGQLPVFPYYDMGFVRAALTYHPGDKYQLFFQEECLRRFYPQYLDFEGTRNIPIGFPKVPRQVHRRLDREGDVFTFGDLRTVLAALKYLSVSNRLLLLLALVSKTIRNKRKWLYQPLLLLVKAARENRPFIHID